jgi:uncharacterized protein
VTTPTLNSNHNFWLPPGVVVGKLFRRPFYTFLLKVASRCNLDCDYCYIYHLADQSWREQPRFMSEEIALQTAQRISEHVFEHQLSEVQLVFHGGEPLLAGSQRLSNLARIMQANISCQVGFGVQTNGILLDEQMLDTLLSINARIGISIDGDLRANNRHRLYHDGRSSYDDVLRSLKLIKSQPQWNALFAGLLVVVDLDNDPDEVYEAVASLAPPSIDLIFPDCHHDAPPARPKTGDAETAYGRWMSRVFERWYDEQPGFDIRYFDEIITLMLGAPSGLETIGATSVDLIVIESNGDIEAVDTLKAVGREATQLGLNIHDNSFDDALEHPAIYSRMAGFEALCDECKACSELRNCGSGYLPHRYGRRRGFMNPSVYCDDLKYLFNVIRLRIQKDLAAARKLSTVSCLGGPE